MKHKPIISLTAFFLMVFLPVACFASRADYDKGVAYLRAGRAEEAIKILEPLKASGDDQYVEYHLGIAYYRTGRLDDADRAFRKAMSLMGNGGDLPLGAAFSNLGVEYYRSGRLDEAAKCLDEALRLSPGDGDSRYYLGLVKMEGGDYEGAQAELARARELLGGQGPNAEAVQNAMGLAYYNGGDNARAEAEFKATLEQDPDNVEALYYLGQIIYKESGYAAAKTYFDRIAQAGATDEKTKKTLFTTFFNMGVDFQDRGKSDAAAEMFERAALLNPGDAETHYYLGYNLMAAQRYQDAVAEFRQALAIDPGMDRARSQLEVAGKFASEKTLKEASDAYQSGDYYAAVPLYEKAVSLDPLGTDAKKGLDAARAAAEKDTASRVSKTRGLLAAGDYRGARRQADELMRLNPDSPDAAALDGDVTKTMRAAVSGLMMKARQSEGSGALGKATGYYRDVLKIEPDSTSAKNGISHAEEVIGRTRRRAEKAASGGLLLQARSAYRELLGYVPGDPAATAGLKSVEETLALELQRRLKDAWKSFDAEDYNMAAYHAQRAAELDPDNAQAAELRDKIKSRSRELVIKYLKEADDYMEQGMRDKASESYESALLLDPGNRTATEGLEKARTSLSPANEEEVRRLFLKGVEYYTKGRFDLAIEAWRELLKIDPSNEKAASSIKRAEEKMKRTEDIPSQAEK